MYRKDKTKGFSLLEVMFAIMIVSAAFAGLALAFSSGLMSIKVTRQTATAVLAVQEEMEEMRGTPFDAIDTHTFYVPELSTNGTVVVEETTTDRKKVSVAISWTSDTGRSVTQEIATIISRYGLNKS